MPGWYIRVGPLCPVCKCSKEYRAYITKHNIDENYPMDGRKGDELKNQITPCYCTNCRVVCYLEVGILRKPPDPPVKMPARKMLKQKAPSRWRIEIDRVEASQ